MVELKKEVELKLWTMIIRPKGIVVDVPEQVRLLLAFDEAEALRTTFKEHPELSVKSTGYFTIEQLKKNLGCLFEPTNLEVPLVIETPKVVDIGGQVKNLLTYLVQDEGAQKEREKLTTTDLNNLKKIIKKL